MNTTNEDEARRLLAQLRQSMSYGPEVCTLPDGLLCMVQLALTASFFKADGPTPHPELHAAITEIAETCEALVLARPELVSRNIDVVEPLSCIINEKRHPLAHNLMMAMLLTPAIVSM